MIDMENKFKTIQKTIFISYPNRERETIYLVDDEDIPAFLEYERAIGNGSVQVLCKNVLVFDPEEFLSTLNPSCGTYPVDFNPNNN